MQGQPEALQPGALMSTRAQAILIATIILLSFASCVAGRLHWNTAWLALGAPSFVLAAWIFFGHLITLDDDATDGFSNPTGSEEFWRRSKTELRLKGLLFLIVTAAIAYGKLHGE